MKFAIDRAARAVSFSLPKSLYSLDALRIAGVVFASRAEVYHEETKAEHRLTLESRRRDSGPAELEALAGDFHNELLNQEYRFLVARFNRKIADLIVTQTLLAARGGENPPAPPAETPEFRAEADRLMAEAAEEIRRTMPRKIAPQGSPIPPLKEADAR